MSGPIRLIAEDSEDLSVLSACLQDAILPVGEMCFQPAEHRFVMVVNRFKWESCGEGAPSWRPGPAADDDGLFPFERILCGVQINGVERVVTRGIDAHDRGRMLELLSLSVCEGGIELTFAGGAALRLLGGHWSCRAEDLGDSWPTSSRPCHGLEEAAE